MRKLILFLVLVLPAISAISQDKEDGKIFLRAGAGFGYRLAQIPAIQDADGRKHYRNLRTGMNTSVQLGYRFNDQTAFALVYNRFGSKAEGKSNTVPVESKEGISIAAITLQKFFSISEKNNINFITKVGPGIMFYNTQETFKSNPQRFADLYETTFGVFTGVGVDFKLLKEMHLELSLDKTWGKISQGINNKINLDYIALGTGIRFEF